MPKSKTPESVEVALSPPECDRVAIGNPDAKRMAMSSDEEYGSDQMMSDDELDADSLGELGEFLCIRFLSWEVVGKMETNSGKFRFRL